MESDESVLPISRRRDVADSLEPGQVPGRALHRLERNGEVIAMIRPLRDKPGASRRASLIAQVGNLKFPDDGFATTLEAVASGAAARARCPNGPADRHERLRSAWIAREHPLDAFVEMMGDEPFAIASITASELLVGVYQDQLRQRRERRGEFVETVLDRVPVLPFDLDAARAHARLFADLSRLDKRLEQTICVIAATASGSWLCGADPQSPPLRTGAWSVVKRPVGRSKPSCSTGAFGGAQSGSSER